MTEDRPGVLIALSAGGKPDELAAQGIGIEHVDELLVRLSMKLLRDGHRLAFGGIMGQEAGGGGGGEPSLTETLIYTARNWVDERSAEQCDINRPQSWPLTNYAAWPFYAKVTEEVRAQLVGICRFVNIDPPGIEQSELAAMVEKWIANPKARRYVADALTAMRERSAQETNLRVVWGGRIAGAKGWMAGILEEVAFSLEHGKPVLILGGFGGCARLLADFLADANAPWPDELSLAACADAERDELLTDTERENLHQRFEQVKAQLAEFRAKLFNDESVNGIPAKLIQEVLHVETPRRVVHAAAEAARMCLERR